MTTKNENTRKIAFVLNGQRVRIEVTVKGAQKVAPYLTIDLTPVPVDAVELSICGDFDGSSGQCQDSIREAAGGNADVLRLCDIWDRWHLNGMKSGTRAQLHALEEMPKPILGDHFKAVCAYLAEVGLLIDLHTGTVRTPDDKGEGYKYGSAWLFEPLPADVLNELPPLLARLKGRRIGKAPDVDDAPDVSESDDIIDSRDVIKRIEIYRDAVREFGVDPETRADNFDADEHEDGEEIRALLEELNALEDLESSVSAPDWPHGESLIRESYFVEHAKEQADSMGLIKDDAAWPSRHIDWEAAADELRRDYSEVTFKGVTYLIRN